MSTGWKWKKKATLRLTSDMEPPFNVFPLPDQHELAGDGSGCVFRTHEVKPRRGGCIRPLDAVLSFHIRWRSRNHVLTKETPAYAGAYELSLDLDQ